MKQTIYLFALLFVSLPTSAQYMNRRDSNDTLVTSDGVQFVVKQDIKLGTGTMPNGDFKFITPSRSSWTNITGTSAYKNVPAKFSGHTCQIKAIKQYGSKKHGYTQYLMLAAGQAMNWECDIENALKAGEVVAPGYTAPNNRAVIVQQTTAPSAADELRKLTKLKDDGILTDAEYAAQKRKILAK